MLGPTEAIPGPGAISRYIAGVRAEPRYPIYPGLLLGIDICLLRIFRGFKSRLDAKAGGEIKIKLDKARKVW